VVVANIIYSKSKIVTKINNLLFSER